MRRAQAETMPCRRTPATDPVASRTSRWIWRKRPGTESKGRAPRASIARACRSEAKGKRTLPRALRRATVCKRPRGLGAARGRRGDDASRTKAGRERSRSRERARRGAARAPGPFSPFSSSARPLLRARARPLAPRRLGPSRTRLLRASARVSRRCVGSDDFFGVRSSIARPAERCKRSFRARRRARPRARRAPAVRRARGSRPGTPNRAGVERTTACRGLGGVLRSICRRGRSGGGSSRRERC